MDADTFNKLKKPQTMYFKHGYISFRKRSDPRELRFTITAWDKKGLEKKILSEGSIIDIKQIKFLEKIKSIDDAKEIIKMHFDKN